MYSACVSREEMALVQASVLHCVRKVQEGASEDTAIRFTTAAAECLSRFNHGSIDQTDVRFLCECMQKTINALHADPRAPQRAAVIAQLTQLQNKLGGPNVRPLLGISSAVRTVLDS